MNSEYRISLDAAELISTGAELLNGRSINSHARTLGGRLNDLGIRIRRDTTVPDDFDDMVDALNGAIERVDLIFLTGGLGPTEDDVTRDAVAHVLGRNVVMDDASLKFVRERYQQYGRTLNAPGERQALIVDGAEPLINRVGVAPGERIETENKVLFLLPGPPRELLAVLEDHVLPWLKEKKRDIPESPSESIFLVCGLGESNLVNLFETHGFPPRGIAVAYGASAGRVELRLSSKGAAEPGILDQARSRIRSLLGSNIVAEERVELEEVIGRLLKDRRATLSTAESCTGGMLGDRITSVSGSSSYYRGGIIAYDKHMKTQWLGVSKDVIEKDGAVSGEVARQMAIGVRERFGTDFGMGITGIAGPGGGTKEKPAGLVYIACSDEHCAIAKRFHFPGGRELVREWSCVTAMDMLRRMMVEDDLAESIG